ncbi:hypothetical protein [Fictibacillus norfolkensis]|uniref:Glycosyltransferase 2-like domain-containing protein n=1 Tax=Fictibacillus norfolkensis TaxID=2762233 RepID=A0ABR8SI53_9BACL|nr:hypothetical protein [Fictibacillus norfolkensis]MBD7963181.1 hypothetical protein [Fictibacillus norfolkensis]
MDTINPTIVLYNQKIDKSITFNTLFKTLKENKELINHINKIFVIDNSENGDIIHHNKIYLKKIDDKVFKILYLSEQKNIGIARAYNSAVKILDSENCPENHWILLLDQDSTLTKELFLGFLQKNKEYYNNNIGIVMPKVICKKKIVSPLVIKTPFDFKEPPNKIKGIQQKRVTGINSCSFINLSAIKKINGFNEDYPIDYLDHITFLEVQNKGYRVYVLETKINHDLSFFDFSSVPLHRYKIYLEARLNFIKEVSKNRKNLIWTTVLKDFLFLHCKRTIKNKMYKHFTCGNKVFMEFMFINKKRKRNF